MSAMDVLTGAVMSDAGVRMQPKSVNAILQVNLSGWEHVDWLSSVGEALIVLGVEYHIRKTIGMSKGKEYQLCYLLTRVHPLITSIYREWYPDGSKEFPPNLELNPLRVANWFMGDGCSTWLRGSHVVVVLKIGSERSVSIAAGALSELGVEQTNDNLCNRGTFHDLRFASDAEVTRFMAMVEPHMLPSYTYKVKYPGRMPSSKVFHPGVTYLERLRRRLKAVDLKEC